MADSSPEIGITINATDMTGPGMASASKSIDLMGRKFQGLTTTLKQLPGHFNRMNGVLMLMGSEFGKMGGATAQVLSKFSGLAGLIGVGGPLGIAVVALTGAVTVLSEVWSRLGQESERAAKQAELFKVELQSIIDKIKEREQVLKNVGKTEEQINSETIKAQIAEQKERIKEIEDLHKLIDANGRVGKIQFVTKKQGLDISKAGLANEYERLRVLESALDVEDRIAAEKKLQNAEKAAVKDEAKDEAKSNKARRMLRMEELKAAIEEEKALEANHDEYRESLRQEREAAAQREYQNQLAREEKLAEEQIERNRQVSDAISLASGHLTNILTADSEERKRAAISAALDEAQAAIVAKAASGAAKAFEGAQSLPFPANLIVGPIVGATVLAAILAFRSQIKLAQGGLVTGGVPGKDSVPALLMPGERVLSKAQVDAGGGGGGGRVTVINNYSMLDASQLTQQTRRRNAQIQGNDIEEMARRGMVRRRR